MHLSFIYPNVTYWAVVYHTQPGSEEVEFVGTKGPKFFTSKELAEKWFNKKFKANHYIQSEIVEFSGFGSLKAVDV